ncbi:MAG: nucleotide exchange factor GrpE, partial [Betaproteobacteria bacterium]|nr:nucleotide exchange factor GrpE [Betaproteobacteria bacterium]
MTESDKSAAGAAPQTDPATAGPESQAHASAGSAGAAPGSASAAGTASADGPAAASAGAAPSALDALARAQAEAIEFRDLYLRAKADTENIRRRGQEDVAKAHKFAIEGFAESLLPVRDSLEMTLANATASPESLKEGVDATLRLLVSAFERARVTELNPVGQKFDPNRHQAISMVPVASTNPPVVTMITRSPVRSSSPPLACTMARRSPPFSCTSTSTASSRVVERHLAERGLRHLHG